MLAGGDNGLLRRRAEEGRLDNELSSARFLGGFGGLFFKVTEDRAPGFSNIVAHKSHALVQLSLSC